MRVPRNDGALRSAQEATNSNRIGLRTVMLLLPPLIGALFVSVFWSPNGEPWDAASLFHPMGTDEFGRDVLATVIAAAGLSLLKGLAITAMTLLSAVAVAELITLRRSAAFSVSVRLSASIIESIPIVLWVLILIIAMPGPRLVVTGAAFCLVVLPIAAYLLAGEFFRLRSTAYVEAAYQLGAGEIRVLLKYMLPNATAVVVPFAIQTLGAAIAVDGAIGVIGLGNRSDLDLGIFLLRGKENFFLHPQILLISITAYGFLYGYIVWAGTTLVRLTESAAEDPGEQLPPTLAAP